VCFSSLNSTIAEWIEECCTMCVGCVYVCCTCGVYNVSLIPATQPGKKATVTVMCVWCLCVCVCVYARYWYVCVHTVLESACIVEGDGWVASILLHTYTHMHTCTHAHGTHAHIHTWHIHTAVWLHSTSSCLPLQPPSSGDGATQEAALRLMCHQHPGQGDCHHCQCPSHYITE